MHIGKRLTALALFSYCLVGTPAAARGADVYELTPAQTARVQAEHGATCFPAPSQAAYAAALRYAGIAVGAAVEVGAVITQRDASSYCFGPLIFGQIDARDNESYIPYDYGDTRNGTIVGLWHTHPCGDSWDSLFGHAATVAATHQTIWTTLGRDLYVQYWNGEAVVPEFSTSAVPAVPALCKHCL